MSKDKLKIKATSVLNLSQDNKGMNSQETPIVGGKLFSADQVKRDKELEHFLPMRMDGEFDAFLETIRVEGIKEPIHVWQKSFDELIVCDGYTRLRAAEKLGIKFRIVVHAFENKEAVKDWMITRQSIERRNLTPWQTMYYRGYAYAKEMKKRGGDRSLEESETPGIRTADVIAKRYGINEKTVRENYKYFMGVDFLQKHNKQLAEIVRASHEGVGLTLTEVASIALLKDSDLTSLNTIEDLIKAVKHTSEKKPAKAKDAKVNYNSLILKAYKKPNEKNVNSAIKALKTELEKLESLLK